MTTPRVESRWADSQLIGTVVRSVWQWQLIVGFSTVAVALGVALLNPRLFECLSLLAGLGLICAITSWAMVMPWARHRDLVIIVPFADTVAIGLLAMAYPALGYLWVVPMAWMATYYSMAAVVSTLALILALQIARWWIPETPLTSPLEVMIVLLGLGFLGIAMNQGARRTRAFRLLIQRQSRQLDRAVARMSVHEDRANGLFDTVSTALARVDARGHIDLANAAYRHLYAYDNDDYRHPPRAVEYDNYRGTALARDATSIARAARGERVENELIWLYDASGEWRALSMSIRGRSVRTEIGDETDVSIIQLDDVTATERERREQRAATSAVSHELRNPLTVIIGHADLMLDGTDLSPSQREHANVIEAAAERMLALTKSLLDSHRAPETTDEFDLSVIAAATADAFAPAAASSDIDLRTHIERELPLSGDGFRLRQVVDNLISNAIKYTPRGGSVDVMTAADDGDAVLRVSDTGIGIAPDDLERVFVPYFRARSATASGIAGTGLGMSIARQIVEENGGTIALESTLGTGTTVTVRLPLAHQRERPEGAHP